MWRCYEIRAVSFNGSVLTRCCLHTMHGGSVLTRCHAWWVLTLQRFLDAAILVVLAIGTGSGSSLRAELLLIRVVCV